MFSTDFIFRQQENLVDIQKCQAGFRQLCNKILLQFLGLGRRKNKVATPKFATFMGDFLHSISNFCENRIS